MYWRHLQVSESTQPRILGNQYWQVFKVTVLGISLTGLGSSQRVKLLYLAVLETQNQTKAISVQGRIFFLGGCRGVPLDLEFLWV